MQMAQRRGGAAIDIIYRYLVQKAPALESELAAYYTKIHAVAKVGTYVCSGVMQAGKGRDRQMMHATAMSPNECPKYMHKCSLR
jgi:hypothetical protein